jgi:DNA-binding transcriptional MerR regulator
MRAEPTLRMRDVCARTGLARSTIHHYIREGVLPQPVKKGRNTALYDEDFVRRAQLVRALQDKTHMPLAEIRRTLDGVGDVEALDVDRFARVTTTIADALRLTTEREVTRRELTEMTGVSDRELEGMTRRGLIDPVRRGRDTLYSPLDVRIVAALVRIRGAGATVERGFAGSSQITAAYRKHLTELARIEAKEMVRMLRPLAEFDLGAFVNGMSEPLGALVAAIHQKALVEAVVELTRDGAR